MLTATTVAADRPYWPTGVPVFALIGVVLLGWRSHRGLRLVALGKTMHLTLPNAEGQDSGCPHQFVGRCDMCRSREGINGGSETDPTMGQNNADRREHH